MTQPIAITDSHCHLDFPDFADELSQVIDRAVAAGVTRMVPAHAPSVAGWFTRVAGVKV